MNTRLNKMYSEVEEQNKDKFLRNEIEIDTTWGKPIWRVTLQVDLGEKVKDLLREYQQELETLEPDNLFLLPRQYQHISFNQVVFWGGKYELGTEGTWKKVSKDLLNTFTQHNRKHHSFKIIFSRLIATTGGIIWCGFDEDDELEKLRDIFLQELPFPNETTKQNHIIHTTVARFKNKLNNPQKLVDFLNSHREVVEMKVEKNNST